MQQKISYVDVAEVLKTSSIGQQEIARNQQVKDILEKAQKDATARYADMTEAQRQKSTMADSELLNRQWVAEQQHARQMSLEAIAKAVETYRSGHNLSVVLSKSQIIAGDASLDISKDIIAQVKATKVDYGALPELTIKDTNSNSSAEKGTSSEKPTEKKAKS
ncbi:hypothetical protein YA29_16555 [Klebsiella aerogenes]|nr:hypothetical protein YA29_16555 [Klebsiella aerogenes]